MNRCVLCLFAFGFFTALPLCAETSGGTGNKIVYEVKVFTWSFEKNVWYEDRTIKRITELYDEKGRIISEQLADGRDAVMEKTLYVYEGKLIKKTTCNPENKISRISVVSRKGNTLTETVTLPDGKLLFQFVTLKDDSGRIVEIKHFDRNKALVFKKVYGYDKKGNLASIKNLNPDGSPAVLISYQYSKFDDRGNWLAREEYFSYADVRYRPHEIVYRLKGNN
jgi:hypothetical protein